MEKTNRRTRTLSRWVAAIALLGLQCGGDDSTPAPVEAGEPDAVAPDGGGMADSSGDTDAGATTDVAADGEASASETGSAPVANNVLYVESNDPRANKNAILAFRRASDGSLTALGGSPFLTGGAGIANPGQILGPDDSDQEIVASADHRRLFAVNGGSATVAVLDIHADGTLSPITGSPFPSGSTSPVSLGIAEPFLYVVNQGQEPDQDGGADAGGMPSYVPMNIAATGALSPIAGGTVAAGASPSQALITPDKKLLFGSDFLAPLSAMPQGSLRSFVIGADGKLTAAAGTPMDLPSVDGGPPAPGALGLAVHPSQKILYAGFTARGQVGVYTYDGATGVLTFKTAVSVSGPAPCWIRTNASGTRIYVVTTGSNSVSVLDSTNSLAPTEIQNFKLKDPGPLYTNGMGMMVPDSQAFQEELSPDGKFLYVVSQRTTTDTSVTEGNVLHALSIGSDGMLSETLDDVKLSVPAEARSQGLVVF